MSEQQIAPRPRFRRREAIVAELHERQATIMGLCRVASEFYAIDTRPFIYNSADGTVTHLGPSPVPEELDRLIAREKAEAEKLRAEYSAILAATAIAGD